MLYKFPDVVACVQMLCYEEGEMFLIFYGNRVEYDAFRTDFETQQQMVLKDPVKLEEAQQKFDLHREKFDRMRSDLNIKMKLLDENKVSFFFVLNV